jgi:surface polysaccharide O-acyltransferase-like enzyme
MRIAASDSETVSPERAIAPARPRLVHLELIRVVAIALVVFNHTGTMGFLLFSVTDNAVTYPLYLFLSILSKIAVPLFFMASGALLIAKDESTRTLYGKRVVRTVCIIVIFSLLQYMYALRGTDKPFSIGDFLSAVYSSPPVVAAYWFLYSYLAVLMLLPFLRRMARGMTNKEFLYLALLEVVWMGVWPIFRYLFDLDAPNLALPLVALNIFFFTMGFFMEHRLPERFYARKYAYIGIGLSIGLIAVSGFMTWLKASQTGDVSKGGSQSFHLGLIAIPTLVAYFLIKYLCKRVSFPKWLSRAIVWLGGTAFGIYLIENIVKAKLKFVYTGLLPYLHTLGACLVWVVAVLIVSAIVVGLLKLIPLVKRAL